ncbi:MAG TPA: hypothetical protein VFM54_13320 [Micromonosporaceae bacterium]|nr:hypothetical protein [Micromonosporaceae bacterium]
MTCRTITTQDELDAAIDDAEVTCVHVESPEGVWLRIDDERPSRKYRVTGSATVGWVGGSATVEWVGGSATVRRVGDSATVEWVGDSATVGRVDGSATVRRVDGSATVRRVTGTAVLHQVDGRARIEHAGPHVAVYLYSGQAAVDGGRIIDLTQLDLHDPQTWCDHHGVEVRDGKAVLYKAVDGELTAGHEYDRPTVYTVGAEVACDDWRDDHGCGGGLHLSPHPLHALANSPGATRLLRVTAAVGALRPILGGGTPKCKTPSCLVETEVDRHAEPLAAGAASGQAR